MQTCGKSLHEAAPHDSVWGIGISMYDSNLMKKKSEWGSNILGKSLERIRNEWS
jgi:predicted NAD-dependent protein-ADP-ribosyltransferase YbiA (DUF1768 family)